MANFVLLHGGGHGAWCWDEVVPRLKAAGHSVVAPDFPGMGSDRTPLFAISLASWTMAAVQAMRSVSGKVIAVAHSLGGIAMSQAAEEIPQDIEALVYVTALLPADGDTAVALAARIKFAPGEHALQSSLSSDGKCILVDTTSARDAFYGCTPHAVAQQAIARLQPQPANVATTPVHLTEARFGKVPKVFISCLRDKAIPPRLQYRMRRHWPCRMTASIDTDHSPFFSAPDELVQQLEHVAVTC